MKQEELNSYQIINIILTFLEVNENNFSLRR